jgi:hypothetical protein
VELPPRDDTVSNGADCSTLTKHLWTISLHRLADLSSRDEILFVTRFEHIVFASPRLNRVVGGHLSVLVAMHMRPSPSHRI